MFFLPVLHIVHTDWPVILRIVYSQKKFLPQIILTEIRTGSGVQAQKINSPRTQLLNGTARSPRLLLIHAYQFFKNKNERLHFSRKQASTTSKYSSKSLLLYLISQQCSKFLLLTKFSYRLKSRTSQYRMQTDIFLKKHLILPVPRRFQ